MKGIEQLPIVHVYDEAFENLPDCPVAGYFVEASSNIVVVTWFDR
jgi:hypothetical protein